MAARSSTTDQVLAVDVVHVIDVVDDMLRPFLLESQDLPLASRVTNRSRADTRLSALASHMADTPVEVRCWSDADFKRVIGEKNAWTDDDEDADDLYGWLDEDNSRIHMLLSQCNTLVSIRNKDVQSWSEESQIDAADSLDTLAHEIQHFVLPDAGEADVECAAFKKIGTIAQRLGANSAETALLARLYRSEVYPNAPDEYRKPSGCG